MHGASCVETLATHVEELLPALGADILGGVTIASAAVTVILFVALNSEERGPLMGAWGYVESPVVPLARTVAMLNMDMIGRFQKALVLQGLGSSSLWAKEIEKRGS